MNRCIQKFLSCFACSVLLFGSLPGSVYARQEAVLKESSSDNESEGRIDFTYHGSDSIDHTASCYYYDNYFYGSSYTYNPSLATMSVCLAMSAFNSDSDNYTDKNRNVVSLMESIGFENVESDSWYYVQPQVNSAGVTVGTKTINDGEKTYTLLALAVRGGNYEMEWGGNLEIGSDNQHDGFCTAKQVVLDFVRDYLEEHDGLQQDLKIWVTGFSRGAATANLTAGFLSADAALHGTILDSGYSVSQENIYGYTFETPRGNLEGYCDFDTEQDISYNNIFNIINAADMVPMVAPASGNFCHFGIDLYLPSQEADPDGYEQKLEAMLEYYCSMEGCSLDNYLVDDFSMFTLEDLFSLFDSDEMTLNQISVKADEDYSISQSVFLNDFVLKLWVNYIGGRENYFKYYQDELVNLMVWMNTTDTSANDLMDCIVLKDGVLQTSDSSMPDIHNLLLMLTEYLIDDPVYVLTFAKNAQGILNAHSHELCWAWLAFVDPNYTGTNDIDPFALFNNGSYRVIRINGDSDVSVYKEDNHLAGSIVNNTPGAEDPVMTAVSEHDEKLVILPDNQAFEIQIVSAADDKIDIGIDEYCAYSGHYNRGVDWFDVPASKGETLLLSVPENIQSGLLSTSANGFDIQYVLTDPDGKVIEADSDLNGTNAEAAWFRLNAVSSNEDYGTVNGSRYVQMGNQVIINARASDGYKFAGWYADGKLVSKEERFKVPVTSDITYTARFEPVLSSETQTGTDKKEDSQKQTSSANTPVKGEAVKTAAGTSVSLYTVQGLLSLAAIVLMIKKQKNN